MDTLKEHGIHLRSDSPGDHKTRCPQCSDQRKKKSDPCLSVTVEPDGGAVWMCHHCEWSGGTASTNLQKLYGAGTHRAPREREKTQPARPVAVPENPDRSKRLYDWFQKRGLSRDTVDAFGVFRTEKWFGERNEPCIAMPYTEDGVVVNVKYRTADKRFRQEGGAKRTLFNLDNLKWCWENTGDKTMVFVEGEMDVMAMWEAGILNAVSLPDGAPNSIKNDPDDKRFEALKNTPWLHEVERVIIATDNDGPGNNLKLELLHRFGKDRCWTVTWPTSNDVEIKDANECLHIHGKNTLRDLVEGAEPQPIDGLYSVSDYRAEVRDIYAGNIQQPVSTGFPILDQIYQVMPGTFNLVTGIPNHGKSNFMDQLAVNLCRKHGWRFAIFSPEHSTANHIRRLSEKVVQLPFDVGPNKRMSETDREYALDFLDGNFHFIESEDEVPTIDWVLEKARAACLRHGIKGLIIDPYNEIDTARDRNKREDEHIRDLISKCKAFCRRHQVAMWLVAHPQKMQRDQNGVYPPPSLYDVSGAAHWNNMCDVGLVVHRDFESGETRVITRKVREQGLYGHVGEAFFRYNLYKHCYEEASPAHAMRRPAPEPTPHWTDSH